MNTPVFSLSQRCAAVLGFFLFMGVVGTIEYIEETPSNVVASLYVHPVSQEELKAYKELQKAELAQRSKWAKHEMEVQSGKGCGDCH